MRTMRVLAELMKADVRERTRRYSFLVTIAATLYLVYLVRDGTIAVHLGNCQPVPNAAWTGMAMALCAITFVGLVGFYIVKNAIERDRETGVGQILAGTPVGTPVYMAGKLLSNFVVLAIVMAILAVAALLLQAFRGGDFDLTAVVMPFVVLALPAMFFVAGLAVFFESVKLLRGGFGNILYFFVFSALIVLPMEADLSTLDVFGLKLAIGSIQADVRAEVPDYDGGFSIGTGGKEHMDARTIVWKGFPWTVGNIARRMYPVAFGLFLVILAAGLFDRFSSSASRKRLGRLRKFVDRLAASRLQKIPGLFVLPFDLLFSRFVSGRILVAEVRLMVQGLAWWYYAVALGLWIASVASDPATARGEIYPFLMIWPVLLWSGMGTRERRFRTGSILFSAPRPLARQIPATWGAGFAVALLFASGILLRLALAGEYSGMLSVAAGAFFIPSLAIALGVWSGTSKTFEAFYVAFWYIGPLHHTISIDFLSTTDAASAAGTPVLFAVLGCGLLLAALGGRWRQISAA
ncbi:MAG TPA: hypothetical protein VMF59_12595 [Bacteroidota bacterium]|nr:hypothetical protein [Bacteroidota bacterium]